MKKKCILLLLSIYFLNYAYSQSDYRSGVVIFENGDSIKGLIFYGSAKLNSAKCLFMINDETAPREFLPSDIQSYRFDKASYYISREIIINGQSKKAFLEWLIKGKLNLYFYADSANNIHYYMEKGSGTLSELHNTKKTVNISGYSTKSEQREFINEMAFLLQDCPDLLPEIKNSTFDDKSLVKIAKDYHYKVCNNEQCIVFERPKRKKVITLGIISECFSSRLNLMEDDINNFSSNKVEVMNAFAGGLYLDISNFDFIGPRFSTQAEITYMRPNYRDLLGDTLFYFNQFRTSLQLKYSIPYKKLKPNFSLGLTYYLRGPNRYGYKLWHVKLDKNIYGGNSYLNYGLYTGNHQFGLNCKIGVDYNITNRISLVLALRYEYCLQFIGFINDPSNNHNLSVLLGIGYRFIRQL
jgi:hypothetical protein